MRKLLLVDGDAVAVVGWPSKGVKARRQLLVDRLMAHQEATGAESDVVFDRYVGGQDQTPAAGGVGVALVGDPAEALGELVEVYNTDWSVGVVTSDGTLIRELGSGVKIMSESTLVKLLTRASGGGEHAPAGEQSSRSRRPRWQLAAVVAVAIAMLALLFALWGLF